MAGNRCVWSPIRAQNSSKGTRDATALKERQRDMDNLLLAFFSCFRDRRENKLGTVSFLSGYMAIYHNSYRLTTILHDFYFIGIRVEKFQ